MTYIIQNGRLVNAGKSQKNDDNTEIVNIIAYKKGEVPQDSSKLRQKLLDNAFLRPYSRYESYEKLDMICMNMINIEKYEDEASPVYIIIEENHITFYTTVPDYIDTLMQKVIKEPSPDITVSDLLYFFMYRLIFGDLIHLEDIEKQLNGLETDAFSAVNDSTFSKQILKIKKHLMWIGLYYEQFINLVYDLTQNINGLLGKNTIKKFKMLESKLNKLNSKTSNLMNYATEIRSAHQAEVDLQLNKSMKILTAITVILMPLTLIVGWYGMNLKMPEYSNAYSYPVVIALSIAVVVISVIYFKKHKWF